MHCGLVQGIQRLYEEGEDTEDQDEGIEGGVDEEDEEEEEQEKECRDRDGLCDRTQNKDQPASERRSRRLKSEVGTKDDGNIIWRAQSQIQNPGHQPVIICKRCHISHAFLCKYKRFILKVFSRHMAPRQ